MRTHLPARTWRTLCFGAAIAALAAPASAQGIARTFDQLQVLVRPGDTVSVTDDAGRETTGRIADLTATTLVFDHDGQRREWREQDVLRIRQRRGDPLGNGAVIGLAVGAGLAAGLVAAFWEDGDEAGLAAVGIAVYGGIGAGIGVGVDALIQKRHVIYERRPAQPTTIALVPLASPHRVGALLRVRF